MNIAKVKEKLEQLITSQLKVHYSQQAYSALLVPFDEVILEDSTCITLPKSAHLFFQVRSIKMGIVPQLVYSYAWS